MIHWRPPSYPGDRFVALAGSVDVGAVFPPIGSDKKWRWRLWIVGGFCEGREKTEYAAKTALDLAWTNFLRRAALVEADSS